MTNDLVKRLREHVTDIRNFHGNVMTAWDSARSMIANGNTGSLPRDIIESYLEGYAEDMQTAASCIEQLEKALREFSCKCSSNCEWERDEICPSWIARTALGENNDD